MSITSNAIERAAGFRPSRGGRLTSMSAAEFKLRNDLPYGQWTCADGREVLFNRFYEPIWQRRPGEAPEEANPNERVGFVKQEWFYTDTTKNKKAAGLAALTQWGLSA